MFYAKTSNIFVFDLYNKKLNIFGFGWQNKTCEDFADIYRHIFVDKVHVCPSCRRDLVSFYFLPVK